MEQATKAPENHEESPADDSDEPLVPVLEQYLAGQEEEPETPEAEPRLYADKYKTVEDLERAHRQLEQGFHQERIAAAQERAQRSQIQELPEIKEPGEPDPEKFGIDPAYTRAYMREVAQYEVWNTGRPLMAQELAQQRQAERAEQDAWGFINREFPRLSGELGRALVQGVAAQAVADPNLQYLAPQDRLREVGRRANDLLPPETIPPRAAAEKAPHSIGSAGNNRRQAPKETAGFSPGLAGAEELNEVYRKIRELDLEGQ